MRPNQGTAGRRRQAANAAALLLAALTCIAAQAEESGQQLVPRFKGAQLVQALVQGGNVLLMRHTATEPVTPDPNLMSLDDCTTQRSLSEQGRLQANRIGASFEKLGIRVGQVLSSPYCRCMETGRLAFGRVETSELLRIGDEPAGAGRDDPGIAIRRLLDTPPEPGANTVLIAHSVTLLYAFGLTAKPEGVAHVFRPSGLGLGRPEYLGMLTPEEWPELAGLDAAGD
jgi:phosphohistidine phosphatase SixA